MDAKSRDELLIRMDERQKQIFNMNMLQEKHLSDLNSKVVHNVVKITTNENKILNIERILDEGIPLKLTKKQIVAGSGSIVTIVASLLLAVGKLVGWW
ncbi:hypothetical protein KKC59_02400 [bacterium]|nr:hypothetical protein [bacterium]